MATCSGIRCSRKVRALFSPAPISLGPHVFVAAITAHGWTFCLLQARTATSSAGYSWTSALDPVAEHTERTEHTDYDAVRPDAEKMWVPALTKAPICVPLECTVMLHPMGM